MSIPASPCPPLALFVLGAAGCGKSTLASAFIRDALGRGEPWCLVDKDTTGSLFVPALLMAAGHRPDDRDSPAYRDRVRDIDYQTALAVAADQLALGVNVVLPGPWARELDRGLLRDPVGLGFPPQTRCALIFMRAPVEVLHARIRARGLERDDWKLENWDAFVARLAEPAGVAEGWLPVLPFGLDEAERLAEVWRVVSHARQSAADGACPGSGGAGSA